MPALAHASLLRLLRLLRLLQVLQRLECSPPSALRRRWCLMLVPPPRPLPALLLPW